MPKCKQIDLIHKMCLISLLMKLDFCLNVRKYYLPIYSFLYKVLFVCVCQILMSHDDILFIKMSVVCRSTSHEVSSQSLLSGISVKECTGFAYTRVPPAWNAEDTGKCTYFKHCCYLGSLQFWSFSQEDSDLCPGL